MRALCPSAIAAFFNILSSGMAPDPGDLNERMPIFMTPSFYEFSFKIQAKRCFEMPDLRFLIKSGLLDL